MRCDDEDCRLARHGQAMSVAENCGHPTSVIGLKWCQNCSAKLRLCDNCGEKIPDPPA